MVGPAGAGNVGFPTVGEGLRVPCGYVPSRPSSDPVLCPRADAIRPYGVTWVPAVGDGVLDVPHRQTRYRV